MIVDRELFRSNQKIDEKRTFWEETETNSPTAIDIAPAINPANPDINTVVPVALEFAATPTFILLFLFIIIISKIK